MTVFALTPHQTDFFVMKRHFLSLLRIFSGVNTAILLIYGPIQCEMGFMGHDNFVRVMSLSDLASLSKVMELPVEYGQPCIFGVVRCNLIFPLDSLSFFSIIVLRIF